MAQASRGLGRSFVRRCAGGTPGPGEHGILEDRLVAFHGNDRFIGMDLTAPAIDFAGLARSMGVEATRVTDPAGVAPALADAIASRAPRLLSIAIGPSAPT